MAKATEAVDDVPGRVVGPCVAPDVVDVERLDKLSVAPGVQKPLREQPGQARKQSHVDDKRNRRRLCGLSLLQAVQ